MHHRKYAKWKATYIHNCLKNGITPQSGPIGGEAGGEGMDEFGGNEVHTGIVTTFCDLTNKWSSGKFDTGGSFANNSSQSDPRNIPGSSDSGSFFPSLPQSYQPNVPSTPPINSNGVNSIPSSLGIPTSGVHAPPTTPSGSNQASPSSSQINYGPAAASKGLLLYFEISKYNFNNARFYIFKLELVLNLVLDTRLSIKSRTQY